MRKMRSNMKYLPAAITLALFCTVLFFSSVMARGLAADEQIIFFPSELTRDAVTGQYRLKIHGWVFEPEIAGVNLELFKKTMALEKGEDSTVLKRRAGWFLTDNERGKDIYIRVGGQNYQMPKTKKNGHFQTFVALSEDRISEGLTQIHAVLPPADQRRFSGDVIRIFSDGLGVISDIDDTIKISNVLDKSALLKNTFQREFQVVPEMSALYKKWRETSGNVNFYYVSSSPWQLYPELEKFMSDAGFPKGAFYLKNFRMKDRSFLNLFSDPLAYKIGAIETIIAQAPAKKFILVGDSGEKDPEVYAAVLKKYPDRILAIYIRDVRADKTAIDARMADLFKACAKQCHWQSFTDPKMIAFRNMDAATEK